MTALFMIRLHNNRSNNHTGLKYYNIKPESIYLLKGDNNDVLSLLSLDPHQPRIYINTN